MSKSENAALIESAPIDPGVALAAFKDRVAQLEQLVLAGEAAKAKGYRSAADIKADIDRETEVCRRLLAERDAQHAKHRKAIDRRLILRTEAEILAKKMGETFSEADFIEEHGPVYQVSPELSRTLHKQHYVVARLEKELAEMLKALGPEYAA